MASPTTTTPLLYTGQRLTREEFERRYELLPEVKKAELIEGVVYMPSPVRHTHHGRPHLHLGGWLAVYEAATPGVQGSSDATVRLDDANEPQPDAQLFIDPECGGQATVDDDGYISGAPELATQVAASTAALDLGPRREAYRRNGVREYLVVNIADQQVEWFALRGDQYEALTPVAGVYRSEVFPGLWLDPAALLAGDVAAVLRVLQSGLATAEHTAFVARLQQQRAARP
jgi:Uma2 family endonuclease